MNQGRRKKKPFEDLRVIGLDTESSHAIAGDMVRIYFRLSESPPLGWSYIFTNVWQSIVYPLKRQSGVEGADFIWIECIPEELGTYHISQIETAVAQTNEKFRERMRQHALNTSHQVELNLQLQAKLQDLSHTLYPANYAAESSESTPRLLGSEFLGKLFLRKRSP